jgi:putative ABC transport system ATP-binding protein
VAIVGPSGCGKTTLLHILGLLDRGYSGQLVFRGQDMGPADDRTRARSRLRQIGFVFQAYHLLPELTLRENAALPHWRLFGNRRRALDRADALLDELGLGRDADRKPGAASGGEMQRAALARAVINEPSVILADEPTGNLDSANAARVLEVMERFNREGRTIITVTHDHEVLRKARRRISMKDGAIIDDTTAPA